MADELRCANCGNTGRFNVVVKSDAINGQWCRVSCSRMCGHIIAEKGMWELWVTANYRGERSYDISPILTGRSAQTVHLG